MKIYLDVCCFNRPFDDLSQDKIRLEAEAVLTILRHCQSEKWELVGSKIIDFEVSKTPDDERKQKVLLLTSIIKFKVSVDETVKKRALELQNKGIDLFDALHIAFAEKGNVEVMLTTDIKLVRKVLRENTIKLKVVNPLTWLMEMISNEK